MMIYRSKEDIQRWGKDMQMLTFIDFFAGIGGFRRGMELAGHKCVGFCEFDKFAVASYTAMHLMTDQEREHIASLPKNKRVKEAGKEEYRHGEWFANDIRRIFAEDIPRADCWCFGFPCQDISLDSRDREAVYFSELSALFKTSKKKIDPHIFSLRTLKTYLVLMEERTSLNFSLRWTKAGTMRNGRLSILPITSRRTGSGYSLLDILEDEVPSRYFLSKEQTEKILFMKK